MDTHVVKPEEVKKTKENSEWQNESKTLSMCDKENQKIGKIFGAISVYRDFHLSDEEIITKLGEKFGLTEEQAKEYLDKAE